MKAHEPLKPYMLADMIEAGVDEAGRGPLAGPVYAAAVILPRGIEIPGLDDSKKLTARQRQKLRPIIEEVAQSWAVGVCSPKEIDELNILRASITAMHRALDQLAIRPQHIIVDGNRFYPYRDIKADTVVSGDATYLSIAAASILAKTYRDEFMEKIAKEYPQYGWDKNMGYPTKAHREAIEKYGPTPYHRMSFTLLDKQLTIPFD